MSYVIIIRKWTSVLLGTDIRIQLSRFTPGRAGGAGSAVSLTRLDTVEHAELEKLLWRVVNADRSQTVQALMLEAEDCSDEEYETRIKRDTIPDGNEYVRRLFTASFPMETWRPVIAIRCTNSLSPVGSLTRLRLSELPHAVPKSITRAEQSDTGWSQAVEYPRLLAGRYQACLFNARYIQDPNVVKIIKDVQASIRVHQALTR